MSEISGQQGGAVSTGYRCSMLTLLWLSLSTGWLVSVFTVIEELCLATACRDTASFTFFGIGMGWLGIAYFSLLLLLLWLRSKVGLLNLVLSAMLFSGIGAEFRLLWIQKYIIGSWCPLCVTICFSLGIAAVVLLIEKVQEVRQGQEVGKSLTGWMVFVAAMVVSGLAIAVAGVKAL